MEYEPKTLVIDLLSIEQDAVLAGRGQCVRGRFRQMLHTLWLSNHFFSVKQRIQIRFQTESEHAVFCDAEDGSPCLDCGGSKIRSIPALGDYFLYKKKQVSESVCWHLSREEHDYNLAIEIRVETVSRLLQEDYSGLTDEGVLICYVEE
jgi:hypothetical protein